MEVNESIILYVDSIDNEIGFGYTNTIDKVLKIIEGIDLYILEEQELVMDIEKDQIKGFSFIGKYICLYSIDPDFSAGSVMLLDCSLSPVKDVEERLLGLCWPPIFPDVLKSYRDSGSRLLFGLREVSLSL